MGGFLAVLILLVVLGVGALVFFFVIKSNNKPAVETPVYTDSIPIPSPIPEPRVNAEPIPKKVDYVPQDTIYSYSNPSPGVCCPACDAENPTGTSYCQICGAMLGGPKYL